MTSDGDGDLPDDVAAALAESTREELRAIIRAAQDELDERVGRTPEIRPRHENEEIVSIEEEGAHTFVFVKVDWSDDVQAYYVTTDPHVEDTEAEYRWHYIGPVAE